MVVRSRVVELVNTRDRVQDCAFLADLWVWVHFCHCMRDHLVPTAHEAAMQESK